MSESGELAAIETFKNLFLACKPDGGTEGELAGLGQALQSGKSRLEEIRGKGGPIRQKVDELRLAWPTLEAKWDKLDIPTAENALNQFLREVETIGRDAAQELGTDPSLKLDLEVLRKEGAEYRERVASDRRMFQFIERTASEIVSVLPKMVKPMEIKGRLDFCRGELAEIEKKSRRTPVRPEFASVGGRVTELRDALDQIETTAKAGMLGKLTAVAAEAAEWAESYKRKARDVTPLAGEDRASVKSRYYREASDVLADQMQELGDWGAQVREAASWLGDTSALERQIVRWTQSCGTIRDAIEQFLPELKSKIGATQTSSGAVVPSLNDTEAEALLIGSGPGQCNKSWVEAKKLYATQPQIMKSLANWRKKVVDAWLKAKLGPLGVVKGPENGWVSVGSDDPTSDYDISINKHGQKPGGQIVFDYEMVRMFNADWRGKYGVETGTLFDTNLYAAAPPMTPKLEARPEATPEEREALAGVDAAMDVGALMKLRRYMSPSDYQTYRLNTLESYSDEGQRREIQKQFDEADDNYRISLTVIIDKVRAQLAEKVDVKALPEDVRQQRAEAKALLEAWDRKSRNYTGAQLAEGAAEMERLARGLEHLGDLNLQATNGIYVDQIGNLRKAEQSVLDLNKLRDEIDALDSHDDPAELQKKIEVLQTKLHGFNLDPYLVPSVGDREFRQKLAALKDASGEAKRALSGKSAELLADLSRQKAMAMYFANEAYQSSGPFKAVVEADQAVAPDVKTEEAKKYYVGGEGSARQHEWETADADQRDAMIKEAWSALYEKNEEAKRQGQQLIDAKRRERREAMSPAEVLQSFNEQLGDFLKDLAHYGESEPGKAIIQSSKYLDRLLEALVLLQKDKALKCVAETSELGREVQQHLALQPRIKKELIGARKGLITMEPLVEGEPIDQDKERKAYACQFMKQTLGVVSVAELATLYSRLGMRVNAAVRKELAQQAAR